jgi:phosphatidylglycerophosphatase A
MSAGHRRPQGLDRLGALMLTAGGLGLLRPAPGTWGSLPPAAVAWIAVGAGVQAWGVAVILLTLCLVATWACIRWGDDGERAFAAKDASSIVIDEVAGGAVAAMPLALVEAPGWIGALVLCGLSFLLFRAFDIWKPGPIRLMQRWSGGLGVVADDLAAGSLAGIVLMVFMPQARSLAAAATSLFETAPPV